MAYDEVTAQLVRENEQMKGSPEYLVEEGILMYPENSEKRVERKRHGHL